MARTWNDVTYEEAKRVLLDIAREFPDKVVRECKYVDANGCPACLIGEFMARVGIPLPAYDSKLNKKTVLGLAQEMKQPIDNTVAKLLWDIQDAQDNHQPWGRAIKEHIEYMERILRK